MSGRVDSSGGVSQPRIQTEVTPPVSSSPDKPGKLQGRAVSLDTGRRLALPQERPRLGRGLEERRAARDEGPKDLGLRHEARYRAIPTKEQLLSRAGRPKNDTKFWFFGSRTWRHSTGYKQILKGVERYQSALGHQGKVGKPQLQELRQQLATIQNATHDYQSSSSHSRKTEMVALNHQAKYDSKLVDQLLGELGNGKAWPDGVSLKDGLTFARQGIAIENLAATLQQDLKNSGMSLEELQPYRDAGFTGNEARLLKESGLGLKGGAMFRETNLRITPETLFGAMKSDNETGFQQLGSGAMNTVYEVSYKDGSIGVFKPLPKVHGSSVEHGWVAQKTGVDKRNPQLAMRNLGTYSLAQKLGFDVIPNTRIAEHGGKLGILMDKADGKPARKTDRSIFEKPEIRREVTKLQVMDALVGQGDRHSNNYFVQGAPPKVIGIDNDQCFGRKLTDPNGIRYEETEESCGFRGVNLPQVMDSEMAEALKDLTPEDLQTLLGDKLTPQEVDATKQRLNAIKAHIGKLEQSGNIIAPDAWGSDKATSLLQDENTSYVGRDGHRSVHSNLPGTSIIDQIYGW